MARLTLLLALTCGVWAGSRLLAQPEATDQPAEANVERGRYLVHHVAHCVQCHTPRTEQGALIPSRLLRGAPMPVTSPYPNLPWAFEAPQLAGLPGWTEEEIVTLLRTGRRPSGEAPRAPMPTFEMTAEDAAAVAAYLKSLGR